MPLRLALCLPLMLPLTVPALAQVSLKSIGDTCIETELDACTVAASGFVAPHDATRLAYQIQRGRTEWDGIGGGVVVFEEKDAGWQLLASDFSGVYYELPELSEAEETLFHLPGITDGTGAYNADLLFQYVPDAPAHWRPVDMESWWDGLEGKLPEGLEIWKGVNYSFGDWGWGDYNARTALWRATDGNCCPSGGLAVIHFALEEGKLVAGDVDYTPPEDRAED